MNNEIKNTLFRFVSMRAPELVADATQKPNFVFQNENDKGIFNTATSSIPNGSTKQAVLKSTASNFTNVKTAEQLRVLNVKLYDFSVWLAKNRYSATEEEIKKEAMLITDSSINLSLIWENLFYQVITQKDFYAKEAAMQLLLASHVCLSTALGTYKERAIAKVVLPKEVFIDEKNTASVTANKSGEATTNEILFASQNLQILENRAIAEENKKMLQNLKNELAQAELLHKKEYDLQYKSAYDKHKILIKPILDAYNKEVEAKKISWCSNQDPTKPLDPLNPCNQPPIVPYPELPDFDFPYEETIDKDFLLDVLSSEAIEVFSSIVNPTDEETVNEELFASTRTSSGVTQFNSSTISFRSLNNLIESLTDANDAIIQQNILDNGSSTIIIGSSVITAPNTISTLLPFQYEVNTRRRTTLLSDTNRMLQISLGIPDITYKIAQVKYKMIRTDETFIEKTSSSVQHFTGYEALLNLSMIGITENLSELSITFQFVNGQIATLSIPNFNLSVTYKGSIKLNLEDNGDNSSEENTIVSPDDTFIPSGFGMKQIGIADYNKVEQSIQGYVEGEVAHIENIMAREFKEKSTRRLRRSEITETTSSETEREQLTDTSTVDRFEMQSEVAKVIADSKDFSAGVNASYGKRDVYQISANANLATHNSKEESTRQAVTNAKEVTERALDRIVSKIKEERIEKILEEFEENNTHGFDNRKGDQHVVGVYRWVDKVFKNQIVNYGKRLMFEFAIPEPARLHWLAMQTLVDEKNAKAIVKPQDPRTSTTYKLENFSQLTDDKLKYWTGIYNVEFRPSPPKILWSGKTIDMGSGSKDATVEITEGYHLKYYKVKTLHRGGSDQGNAGYSISNESNYTNSIIGTWSETLVDNKLYVGKVPVGAFFRKAEAGLVHFDLKFELNDAYFAQWQQETFNAIIKAYEKAVEKHDEVLAIESANGVQILGTNPGFYREIENTILRKNCISYMISSNRDAKKTFGRDFYKTNDGSTKIEFGNAMINQNSDLDNYAAFVKFMEQAFEWDIMSYYFYPYYWGYRNNWVKMYQYDDTHDHIFKAFMQSGMARVIVTVRPGFEEAVRYYMQTGQIWNGGEVPVIGDELYLSIVEEMRKTEGEKVGKAWPTRIPTSMTILQAESIGLKVEQALPFDTESLNDFENPDEVPQSSQIKFNDAQIGGDSNSGTANLYGEINGNEGIEAKILLKKIDGSIQDMTYCDVNGKWELKNLPAGKFELLLDAQNDFPETEYIVMEGSKEQMVVLEINTAKEVNLKVKKIV